MRPRLSKRSARATRPRTAHAYAQLSRAKRETYGRSLSALSFRRAGLSLTAAARKADTTVRTVLRTLGDIVMRGPGGRYGVKASDRLFREMRFLTRDGVIEVGVTDSRVASTIARYWAAVDRFLTTGETSALKEFRGKSIRIQKVAYRFVTDPKTLKSLGRRGEISFEDLYVR